MPFAAALHATWNALVKSGPDRLVIQTLVIGTVGFAGLIAIPFVPIPDPASWAFLGLSLRAHFG